LEKINWIEQLQPLSWGAESVLYVTEYLGKKVVLKHRIRKKYMDNSLSKMLLQKRTINEAKILIESFLSGVNVPLPLFLDPEKGILVINYIEGILLKELVEVKPLEWVKEKSCALGEMVRKLHNNDIIHGDLTTSNVIIDKKEALYLIDFGLAFHSNRPEDKAVDIRVLERAVVSTHTYVKNEFMDSFFECYLRNLNDAEEILYRYNRISLMGRYVKKEKRIAGRM